MSTSVSSSVTSSVSVVSNGSPDSTNTSGQTPNRLVQKLIVSGHNETAASSPIAPSLANEKMEKSSAENGEIKIDEKQINAVHLAVSDIRPTNESKSNDLSIESSSVELHISKPTDANLSSISANSAPSDSVKPAGSKPPAENGSSATTSNLAINETSLSDRFEALNESPADSSNNKSHADRSIGRISDDLSSNVTINLTENNPAGPRTNSSAIRKADNLPASSTIDETKVLDNRSTNEEDEFDEFEKDETKKEDESSIIENDKASNKVEGGGSGLSEKIANKENKGNEEERSTPKSISSDKKYGEADTANEDEEDDEFANSSNPANSSTNSNGTTNLNASDSLPNDKKESEPTNSTQPADDSEHEDDEEEELDEEVHTSKKVPANQANGKRKPGERERASLNKLQAFLQSTVEQALKSALPELVKSGYETNLSPSCQNSFLAVTRGLQGTRQWAYKSEFTFGFLPDRTHSSSSTK